MRLAENYFNDAAFPHNMPGVWDFHFGFVKELTRRPIVLGEFGGMYTDQDRQWQDWALPYCKQQGISLFYFALNPDSEDTGGLVPKDWSTPAPGSNEAAKLAALEQLPVTRVFDVCPACSPNRTGGGGTGTSVLLYGGGASSFEAVLPFEALLPASFRAAHTVHSHTVHCVALWSGGH